MAHVPDSFVIARNTASAYKGKPVDAKAIGKDLSVRYVLEGSVQPARQLWLEINAQLIDADGARTSGSTIRHPPRRFVADAG